MFLVVEAEPERERMFDFATPFYRLLRSCYLAAI